MLDALQNDEGNLDTPADREGRSSHNNRPTHARPQDVDQAIESLFATLVALRTELVSYRRHLAEDSSIAAQQNTERFQQDLSRKSAALARYSSFLTKYRDSLSTVYAASSKALSRSYRSNDVLARKTHGTTPAPKSEHQPHPYADLDEIDNPFLSRPSAQIPGLSTTTLTPRAMDAEIPMSMSVLDALPAMSSGLNGMLKSEVSMPELLMDVSGGVTGLGLGSEAFDLRGFADLSTAGMPGGPVGQLDGSAIATHIPVQAQLSMHTLSQPQPSQSNLEGLFAGPSPVDMSTFNLDIVEDAFDFGPTSTVFTAGGAGGGGGGVIINGSVGNGGAGGLTTVQSGGSLQPTMTTVPPGAPDALAPVSLPVSMDASGQNWAATGLDSITLGQGLGDLGDGIFDEFLVDG
ncbi:hypothetical protein BC832DRAFT_552936 [Gaertneriomyces semiglobifer]|nr:hypothetical protein BC832DRAFT_552936 [Gaertneriomyces semiglobifer]